MQKGLICTMATPMKITLLLLLLPVLATSLLLAEAQESSIAQPQAKKHGHHGKFAPGPWNSAHATFYYEAPGGACGFSDYEKIVPQIYKPHSTALSSALYNDGQACGACYEIRCTNSPRWCKPGQPSVVVTATDHCPPNWAQSSDNGGWCNPPRPHFDLSIPAFPQIAEYKSGIVPVSYRRVPCQRQGGIRFSTSGNPYFLQVLVWNVAGVGDVESMLIKGDKSGWTAMKRNWGQNWNTDENLTGQSLSLRVVTSDKRRSTSWHIAPPNWQIGQTFEGKNFK